MAETGSDTPPSVYVHVASLFEQISAVAWQKLGLKPDQLTGTIVKDLDEARVAIDLAGHLASVMEPTLDAEDRRTLQGMVRDLRLNYVQKRKDADR